MPEDLAARFIDFGGRWRGTKLGAQADKITLRHAGLRACQVRWTPSLGPRNGVFERGLETAAALLYFGLGTVDGLMEPAFVALESRGWRLLTPEEQLAERRGLLANQNQDDDRRKAVLDELTDEAQKNDLRY